MNKIYMCIDLKSFYASVECVERNLDPLDTNLVVADKSRTEKTICLAVSPSLKEYGLKGRARLFEVVGVVRKVNNERRKNNNYRKFTGKSYKNSELKNIHGYSRCDAAGLSNMQLQGAVSIFAVNLKRILKLKGEVCPNEKK